MFPSFEVLSAFDENEESANTKSFTESLSKLRKFSPSSLLSFSCESAAFKYFAFSSVGYWVLSHLDSCYKKSGRHNVEMHASFTFAETNAAFGKLIGSMRYLFLMCTAWLIVIHEHLFVMSVPLNVVDYHLLMNTVSLFLNFAAACSYDFWKLSVATWTVSSVCRHVAPHIRGRELANIQGV